MEALLDCVYTAVPHKQPFGPACEAIKCFVPHSINTIILLLGLDLLTISKRKYSCIWHCPNDREELRNAATAHSQRFPEGTSHNGPILAALGVWAWTSTDLTSTEKSWKGRGQQHGQQTAVLPCRSNIGLRGGGGTLVMLLNSVQTLNVLKASVKFGNRFLEEIPGISWFQAG